MKTRRILAFTAFLVLSATLFTSCMMMGPVRTVTTVTYDNPQWAPPYYSGAHYYYLPDLELYYDLSTREFIYLVDGRWQFTPYVPGIYRNYDLDNCFCVVLNVDVYRPWLHHQYYISHYPRYYYRDYYDHSGIPYVRAYNENLRRAVYWRADQRQRARPWDNENLRDNRRFKYSKEDRREQQNQSRQDSYDREGDNRGQQPVRQETRTTRQETQPTRQTTQPTRQETQPTRQTTQPTRQETQPTRTTNTSQEVAPVRNNRTNYYGRTIGNSVRVTKQMRDIPQTPAATKAKQGEPRR